MTRQVCSRCQLALVSCYCHALPALTSPWPVIILQESSEARHALGTARIAALGLDSVALLPCRLQAPEICTAELTRLLSGYPEPALIYPGEDAEPLSALDPTCLRPLLFIDATWRKSRRMLHTLPALAGCQRYSIEPGAGSRYRIRKPPFPSALSTLEALVQVLGSLEQRPGYYSPLLDTMDAMVENQISHMGKERYFANYRNGR